MLNTLRPLAARRRGELNLEEYHASVPPNEPGILAAFPSAPGFEPVAYYTVRGSFCWAQPRQPGNGFCYGLLDIDLVTCRNGRYYTKSLRFTEGARGGEVKLEGVYTAYNTGQISRVVLVDDVLMYGSRLFSRFSLGQRVPEFNPKYAKLGWSGYWDGEEWWTEPEAAPTEATAL